MRGLRRAVAATCLVLLPAVATAQTPAAPSWTAPPYADTSKFSEVELRVGGDSALPALLTLPRGHGPFPAVVLVHGSGPNDRNEALGPNRTFEDIAWGLASRGIAVLRYDKRTLVAPRSFFGRAYTVEEETIRDARDAVTRLTARADIDPLRIVLLGHSLGGILAPRIAKEDGRFAGIVIAEGATRGQFLAMMDSQLTYIRSVRPQDSLPIDRMRGAVARAKAVADSLTPADSANTRLIFGIPASYYVDLARYDPATVTRTLDLPVLVLQGGRDYQVAPAAMAEWRRAVGEHPWVSYRTFPALNHLMMPGTGTPGPDEYGVPNHVAAEVVDFVAGWISGLSPRPAPRP